MNKHFIVKNILWKFLENIGTQLISFVVSFCLARLLAPSVYGTIALVTAFTSILNIFIDGGLGTALIQKKEVCDLDYSTVFVFNLIMCIFLYALLFIAAPFIADFFDDDMLSSVLRVLALTLIISGLKNIQIAYVSRQMLFKKFFFSTLGGTIVSSLISLVLAFNGFGVWALVALNLVNNLIDTIILWFIVPCRPKFKFSFENLRQLLSFGVNLLFINLINSIFINIRQFIIGKKFGKEDLAFFSKGQGFPYLVGNTVISSIQTVLFPVFSNLQNDKDNLFKMAKNVLNIGSYLVMPILIGFSACSNSVVLLLLTSKWERCIPYIKIFSFFIIVEYLAGIEFDLIKSLGKSRLCLGLQIFNKIINTICLLVSMFMGVYQIALGLLISDFIFYLILIITNKFCFNFSIKDQLLDVVVNFVLSLSMGIAVYLVNFMNINLIFRLFVQVFIGVFVYLVFSFFIRKNNLKYIKAVFRKNK